MKQFFRYIYLELMEHFADIIHPYMRKIILEKSNENNNCYKAITYKEHLRDKIDFDVIRLEINKDLNTSILTLENCRSSDYLYTKLLYLTNNTDTNVKLIYNSKTIQIKSKHTLISYYNNLFSHVNIKLFIKN